MRFYPFTLAAIALLSLLPPSLFAFERPGVGSILRYDPALDRLVAPDAKLEVVAAGFSWSEGPVWDQANNRLLWSDVPKNTIYQWVKGDQDYSVFMHPSGFTGIPEGTREPGSNGLTFDSEGRLLICEHGDRRVAMLTEGGGKITLADRYDGKRFNSPNDLHVASDGSIYFTDPPYGLNGGADSKYREMPWFGVYRIETDGSVTLLSKECERPNGIALSPDEKTLYVAQSHRPEPYIFAWDIRDDGSLGPRRTLFDFTDLFAEVRGGGPDGMKVDREGNLWATGAGGVAIVSPEGRLLGHIFTGQATANCNWGEDGSVLYITSDFFVLRLQTLTRGDGW